MKLFVDDCRMIAGSFDANTDWHEWVLCRSVKNAIAILSDCHITFMSLDHDMGQDENGNNLPTGYDLLNDLEDLAAKGYDFWPTDGVIVHSANPVGSERMQVVIDRYYNKEK